GIIAYTFFLHIRFFDNIEMIRNLSPGEINDLKMQLGSDALAVLVLAVGSSLFFSIRKSKKAGLKIWTPVSRRLLSSLMIPLVTGGILIIIFFFKGYWQLIIPSMLVFYGLALVSAGKFTYSEVFYLGIAEILTGIAATVIPGYGILLWCFGFGILHVIYGIAMYRKYK
ncbi:MAG TPA: hypothetical protein VJ963_04670, partial [Bacteroidales bacterium]|nr:hypothetical protein [Bacteroidales bacterium]